MVHSEPAGASSKDRKTVRMCEAQARLMLAEHSAMVARMVAALTHELNSPLGTMVSSLDTVRGVLAKMRVGQAPDMARLAELETQIEEGTRNARSRIHQVISRIQRYANLYGAKRTSSHLADLVDDVIALLDPTLRKATAIHANIPADLTADCQPDQISAVASILLHHLMETRPGHPIVVTGEELKGAASIRITSPALVLTAEEMRCLARPGKSEPCTWNFYAARQILVAQGGDLRVSSHPDTGTIFEVWLPLRGQV